MPTQSRTNFCFQNFLFSEFHSGNWIQNGTFSTFYLDCQKCLLHYFSKPHNINITIDYWIWVIYNSQLLLAKQFFHICLNKCDISVPLLFPDGSVDSNILKSLVRPLTLANYTGLSSSQQFCVQHRRRVSQKVLSLLVTQVQWLFFVQQ